jgi:LacI family transcriptional regulator
MSRTGRSARVTLADVAVRADVSLATASRALAGDTRISAPTRAAVRRAARQLGYVPNVAARGLRARQTRALGLLLADLADPVHGQVASGFEQEAAASGYDVIIVSAHDVPEEERRAMTVFMERATDGICLASSALDPEEAKGRAGSVPIVVVQPDHEGRISDPERLPPGTIRTDDETGVEQAARHLIASGNRDIAYLGSGARATNRLRQAAVERVVREASDRIPRAITLPEHAWTDPDAVSAALGPHPPDAVICYDDKLALALLDGLRRRGLGVPRDVAVTGFDDIPFARLANPRLTTVATPVVEIGRLAARSLVGAIDSGQLPPPVVMPVELVIRESSVRAGRRGRRPGSDAVALGGGQG